ncbi:MAG: dihydrofolate reductase [Paludibacteraceae bacterium]|nr:dihydrofolate reductase [Paludibacteraceae bacterium]
MKNLILIAAVDRRMGIGRNNQLLCHLRADMLHFKELTLGHTVVMGRNTFESLPKGALPGRRNIVISSNKDYIAANCDMARSLEEAFAMTTDQETVFVIGGGSLYRQTIGRADRLEITWIDAELEADTFFPPVNDGEWRETASLSFPPDEKNPYGYRFASYVRSGKAF